MIKDSKIFTLHRYYIWSLRMKNHFDIMLKPIQYRPSLSFREFIPLFCYMSFWYGSLYVVIEGWRKLKLEDKQINKLLKDPMVELLKRYRNGVFHYQSKYEDRRFKDLMKQGIKAREWIADLNDKFDRYFIHWLKKPHDYNGRTRYKLDW